MREALRIAYITLWGRYTARSMEVAFTRATGIATVLGEELNAPINVVLAGILHEVVATLNLTSQLRTETDTGNNNFLTNTLRYKEPSYINPFHVFRRYAVSA